MSREWKPGDIADINGSRVMRLTGGRWGWVDGVKSSDANTVRGARPLVVIDPEDSEQVEPLFHMAHRTPADLAAALREFANPTPPKPDEPQGLGAVVEDAEGVPWVRCENADLEPHWYARNKKRDWSDVAAVRVLSEGVAS